MSARGGGTCRAPRALEPPRQRLPARDRQRLLDLFGFDYRLEIYVPPANRRGYYVLPVLSGDRLIARVDAKADRHRSVLSVPAMHMEASTGAKDVATVHAELEELATWLGLDRVAVDRLVKSGK